MNLPRKEIHFDTTDIVAMYCYINKGEICYWDSYGIKPNSEVVVLMNRLKEQSSKLNKPI